MVWRIPDLWFAVPVECRGPGAEYSRKRQVKVCRIGAPPEERLLRRDARGTLSHDSRVRFLHYVVESLRRNVGIVLVVTSTTTLLSTKDCLTTSRNLRQNHLLLPADQPEPYSPVFVGPCVLVSPLEDGALGGGGAPSPSAPPPPRSRTRNRMPERFLGRRRKPQRGHLDLGSVSVCDRNVFLVPGRFESFSGNGYCLVRWIVKHFDLLK